MQRLIQPINKATISASFGNTAYLKKFGYEHWGVDLYGELQAWCQGDGIVTATGSDATYGNFVQIVYPDVEEFGTVVATYCHLASIGANMLLGRFVNKDSKLGVVGKTGNATGIHLHLEMRLWEGDRKRMISPFKTQNFAKDTAAAWFNPLNCMYCKTNSPDNQTRTFADTTYTNSGDRSRVLKTTYTK